MPFTFVTIRDRIPAGIVPLPYGWIVCADPKRANPATAAAAPTNSRRESLPAVIVTSCLHGFPNEQYSRRRSREQCLLRGWENVGFFSKETTCRRRSDFSSASPPKFARREYEACPVGRAARNAHCAAICRGDADHLLCK